MDTTRKAVKKPKVKRSPRVALTIPPDALAALRDLANATKKPVSSVIAEFLVEMAPQFHDIAKLVRLTQAGRTSAAKKVLRHMIGNAAAEIATSSQPELFKTKP